MYAVIARCFLIWYFFECCFERIDVYFSLRSFFDSLYFFFFVINPFGFSVPLFYSKLVLLPLHPVVGMFSCIFPRHAGRIFFVNLECSVLSALFDPVSISFVFLLLSVPSDLFSRVVSFVLTVLLFSSRPNIF